MVREDVLRFLRTTVGSVWALELLLLMRREAVRDWTVDGLTRELRSSDGIIRTELARLGAAGLVVAADGVYRYHPANAALGALVEQVAANYATFPIAVTQAVLEAPNRKIQLFADAFRVKRE